MTAKILPFDRRVEDRVAIARFLRDLADEVERGEIASVALAASHHDGCIGTYYRAVRGLEDRFRAVGAVASLQRRLLDDVEDEW